MTQVGSAVVFVWRAVNAVSVNNVSIASFTADTSC